MEQTDRRRRRGSQSFSKYVFDDVNASAPVMCGLRMPCEEPRKSTIEIFQCKNTIRKQVHRNAQKHLCADRSEANHQKLPCSKGFMDTVAMLQGDDPRVSVLGCSPRVQGVDNSMRRSEVQHDRDFEPWEMPLLQWPGQEAITREVTQDVITERRVRRPLCRPPAAEIRSMAADVDTG